MTIGSLKLKLRPLKVGVLVNPVDSKSVQKAIHLNTMLWGGMYNPLIPCYKKLPKNWEPSYLKKFTAPQIIHGYIEGFDPDFIVNLSGYSSDQLNFPKERIFDTEKVLAGFDKDYSPTIGIGIFEIARKFRYDEARFLRRFELTYLSPKLDKRYDLFLSSIFGDMNNHETTLIQDSFSKIPFSESKIDLNNFIEKSQGQNVYPLILGAQYLKGTVKNPTVFYMDAKKSLDIIDFWNLRAAGWDVLPVPRQIESDDIINQYCRQFIEDTQSLYVHGHKDEAKVNILKGRSICEESMLAFCENLKKNEGEKIKFLIYAQNWYPRFWDEWARSKAKETVTDTFSKEKTIEFQKNQTEIRFRTIDPDFELFSPNSGWPKFAIEVDSQVYGEELFADVIPFGGNNVSRAIGRHSIRDWRVSRTGPVYMSSHVNWAMTYSVPLAEDVLKAWLIDKGWKVELSASGKIAKQMLKQLGGVWGINHLKEEQLLKLLYSLKNNGYINENDFKGIVSRIVSSNDSWLSRDDYIKKLLEATIFQLGVALKCPICSQSSWYTLKEVENDIQCKACVSKFQLQSINISHKKWAYKPFGTFGLPKQSYGALGVLLTYSCLIRIHDRASALLSFEAKTDKKEIEADLLLIKEKDFLDKSTQEVFFCECKTYNNFENKDVERMRSIADEFPGAALVFSTLKKELTPNEKKLIKSVANRGRKNFKTERTYNPVIVLTGNELLSLEEIPSCWESSDGLAKEIANSFYGWGADQLADATQQIYLGMKPYREWQEEQWNKRVEGKIK